MIYEILKIHVCWGFEKNDINKYIWSLNAMSAVLFYLFCFFVFFFPKKILIYSKGGNFKMGDLCRVATSPCWKNYSVWKITFHQPSIFYYHPFLTTCDFTHTHKHIRTQTYTRTTKEKKNLHNYIMLNWIFFVLQITEKYNLFFLLTITWNPLLHHIWCVCAYIMCVCVCMYVCIYIYIYIYTPHKPTPTNISFPDSVIFLNHSLDQSE